MLADIDFPWDVRPIVESHHERWDGTGYPMGLQGEAIPYTARLFAVIDAYDALTSDRPYRAAGAVVNADVADAAGQGLMGGTHQAQAPPSTRTSMPVQ